MKWRVVAVWPDWQWASKVVTADTELTACAKVARYYRRFYGIRVEIHDAYRMPETIKAEAAKLADAPNVPMTLAQAIEATLSGLHSMNRLADEYQRSLRKEQTYNTERGTA